MPYFDWFLELLIANCRWLVSRVFISRLWLLLMMMVAILSLSWKRQRHWCGRLLVVCGMWWVGQHAAGAEIPQRPRQRQRAGRGDADVDNDVDSSVVDSGRVSRN